MTKAIGYIRVSTNERAQTGLSLDAQRRKIEAQAIISDLTLTQTLADAFQVVGIGALIQVLPAPNHTDTSKSHLTMRNSQTTLDQKPKLI